MTRTGARRFLHFRQIIRAASPPAPDSMAWIVGNVEWRRAPETWHIMVVTKSWWDGGRRLLRAQVWATYLAGDHRAGRALDRRRCRAAAVGRGSTIAVIAKDAVPDGAASNFDCTVSRSNPMRRLRIMPVPRPVMR